MTNEEGPRLRHLRLALHKMLQATIKSCTGLEKTEQCFPFALTPDQIQHLEALLAKVMHNLYDEIQTPIEALIQERDIATKLNDIDRYLQAHPDSPDDSIQGMNPEERVACYLKPVKNAACQKLSLDLTVLTMENVERQAAISAKREELRRRCEHLKDTQKLYDATFEQLLAQGTGKLEALVDRMINQTVPNTTIITTDQ